MEKQPLVITFAGGIDTKTDEFQVLPTKFAAIQNGIQNQTGQLAKRWGYRALGRGILGSSSVIASLLALNACQNELLSYDGQNCYSYSQANDAWVSRGTAVSVIETNQLIVRNSSQQLTDDFASLGGIEVYAWEDSRGGVRYSVLDATTGARLVTDQPLWIGMPTGAGAVQKPKVLAFPSANAIVVLVVATYGGVQRFSYVTVNPQNPTQLASSATTLGSVPPGNTIYDAYVTADGTRMLMAFFTTIPATPSALAIYSITSSLQVAWTYFFALGAGNLAVSITADAAGNAWVACATSLVVVDYAVVSPSGTLVQALSTLFSTGGSAVTSLTSIIDSVPGAFGVGNYYVFAEQDPANPPTTSATSVILTGFVSGGAGGAFTGPTTLLRGVELASKPFEYNGVIYINIAYDSALQPTYFTVDRTGQVVAKINPGNGGGWRGAILPTVQAIRPGVFKFANLIKGGVQTTNGTIVALLGVNATTLDFADSDGFLSCFINGGFYTVGGVIQSYDGAQYVEHGFHTYPEGTTPSGGGGGNLGTGTYQYVITYEWVDNNGLRQISTPSTVVSAVFGSGTTNSVTLTIPTLRITKKARVQIVVYRTVANGTLFYQVTSPLIPLYNDPTVDTVTLVDTLADSAITSNTLCYTQPLAAAANGSNPILPNAAPPSASLIVPYADRVFLGGLDQPNQLQYSKPVTANVPIEFANLVLNVDPDGGPVTALARMDDKLIVFKSHAIFYLIGQGPDATGANNDFGDLVAIPSGGVGAKSQISMVLTPIGLMFDSGNGIYLLDRGLNVSYKGAPAQQYNSLSITSAQLIPNQWVVFTTSSDTAIVYDYFYDQWGTFTGHAAIDSALFTGEGGLYAFARTNGQVMLQTPGSYSDAGNAIPLSATTAWITPGVLQGYQRVYFAYILGQYQGTHTLNVGVATNYNETNKYIASINVDQALSVSTFGSSTPFGIDALFGGSNGDPDQYVYEFRTDILQKCTSLRLSISETEPVPNQAMSLSAITLMLGVKRGGPKLPAVKQIGAS